MLGLGTGITAGATAAVFDHTTVVEVNPAVMQLLPRFAAHNQDLHRNPNVELLLDDGLNVLAREQEPYDAIVNTVTGPLYFSSSKLYTRDFFELVKRRLTPGGVYGLWFDNRVTPEGAEIIFATLRESFSDCHLVFLAYGYLQLVCSDGPLRARDPAEMEWPESLRARVRSHGLGLEIEALLPALLLPSHDLFRRPWDADQNTFDLPALEFLMATRALRTERGDRVDVWTAHQLLRTDLFASPLQAEPVEGDVLVTRCYALRVLAGTPLPGCEAALLAAGGGAWPRAYADRLFGFAEASPDANAVPAVERLGHVRRLLDRGELLRARERLDQLRAEFDDQKRFLILDARATLEAEGDVPDASLARLFARGPLLPEVRRLLARTSASRGGSGVCARASRLPAVARA